MRGHQFGESRLGDAGHGLAVLGVIRQLVAHGACIGGHGHGAEPCAGVPGEQRFNAVVQVDEHALAAFHPAPVQAAGDAFHTVVKRAVADALWRAFEGHPDDEGVVAPRQRALFQQPRHIHADEGVRIAAGEHQ